MADRLDFEIDTALETGLITGHAGVPGLIEAFRLTGTAAVIDREVKLKQRKRGLSASQMVESRLALWAEQDVIVADEFRDGNVPAGSGNRRVVEKAIAALPGGIEKVYLRGDSALYEHELMGWLDGQGIGYAISADMSPQLAECIAALPDDHWKRDGEERDATREWAEVNYLPSDGNWRKDAVSPRRYLAIRIRPRQGELLGDGRRVRHFCIVTNRSDPEKGSGLDLIRWHRGKAGTIEHAHDVIMNELAGAALPSQKFGANAAWLRHITILFNLLSAYKRVASPEEFHTARPKRLRFLLLNTVGKVVRHARETILRCAKLIAQRLAGPPRTIFALTRPDLAGV